MKFGAYHHLHKRKRKVRKNKRIELLDKVVLIVSFVYPLTTLPQILKIWIEKSVQGISLLTWTLYLALSIPMLFYGIAHKDKPITVMYTLWIIVHIFVIVGTLLYR